MCRYHGFAECLLYELTIESVGLCINDVCTLSYLPITWQIRFYRVQITVSSYSAEVQRTVKHDANAVKYINLL